MIPFAFFIGFGLIAWVIYPLFQRKGFIQDGYNQVADLEDKKLRVYGNIKDLEFDYALGRLSENDFQTIRNRFTSEATQVLARIEQLKKHDLDLLIKYDLERLKSSPRPVGEIRTKTNRTVKYCIECGEPNPLKAKFCSACGENFEKA